MDPRVETGNGLVRRAIQLSRRGTLREARDVFREAEGIFLACGDEKGIVRVLVEEAQALASSLEKKNVNEALSLVARAEGLLHEDSPPELRGALLHARGYALLRANRPGAGLNALFAASKVFGSIGDAAGEARVLDTLGGLWTRRGNLERAALLVARALALKQLAGDREGAAISLGNLGRIALRAGRIEEAESFLQLDLSVARELGDRRGECMVHIGLAECRLKLGQASEARRHASLAREIAWAARDKAAEGFARVALSSALQAEGSLDAAIEEAREAEARFIGCGLLAGVARARLARGRALSARGTAKGTRGEAALLALRAARAARNGGAPDLAIECLLEARLELERCDDRRRARSVLERARQIAMTHGLDEHFAGILSEERAGVVSQANEGEELHVTIEDSAGRLAGVRGEVLLRVEGFLGQGRFGTVVRVRDVRTEEEYALKRLHPGAERLVDMKRRLRREFTAVSRIDHARIARAHAVGSEDGRPCLLLDLIATRPPFGNLEQLLEHARILPLPLAARICRDIAEGLAALHEGGIVHRDLKPANVLLDLDQRGVLTDYGLAFDLHEEAYVPLDAFKGTLAYAAPELCGLDGERPRAPAPAADLYALGVILFQALTGKWPHPFEESQGSLVELFRMKVLPLRGVEELRAAVPGYLAETILSLLAPRPEERPRDARRVASVLERASKGPS